MHVSKAFLYALFVIGLPLGLTLSFVLQGSLDAPLHPHRYKLWQMLILLWLFFACSNVITVCMGYMLKCGQHMDVMPILVVALLVIVGAALFVIFSGLTLSGGRAHPLIALVILAGVFCGVFFCGTSQLSTDEAESLFIVGFLSTIVVCVGMWGLLYATDWPTPLEVASRSGRPQAQGAEGPGLLVMTNIVVTAAEIIALAGPFAVRR